MFIIVFVGIGVICVYLLFGCKKNNWEFLVLEVDEINFIIVEKNIYKNNM